SANFPLAGIFFGVSGILMLWYLMLLIRPAFKYPKRMTRPEFKALRLRSFYLIVVAFFYLGLGMLTRIDEPPDSGNRLLIILCLTVCPLSVGIWSVITMTYFVGKDAIVESVAEEEHRRKREEQP